MQNNKIKATFKSGYNKDYVVVHIENFGDGDYAYIVDLPIPCKSNIITAYTLGQDFLTHVSRKCI